MIGGRELSGGGEQKRIEESRKEVYGGQKGTEDCAGVKRW